jgi:hypothetical protein
MDDLHSRGTGHLIRLAFHAHDCSHPYAWRRPISSSFFSFNMLCSRLEV